MAQQAGEQKPAKFHRTPPYSEEAERGVLGCILLDAANVLDLCVEKQITEEAFHTPWHRVLFHELLEMHNAARVIDLLTLGERLRTSGMIDQVGGDEYIEKLVDSTPTAAHAAHYIDIVRQKHLLRGIILNSQSAIDDCYEGTLDADLILDKTEQALYDVSNVQRANVIPWSAAIKEAMTQLEHIIQDKRDITGLPTGFADLDKITKGLQPGDMIIVAARPSMGKTSLAMNIAENVALGDVSDHTPRPVAIFSLEMSRESLVKRMLCSRAGVPMHKLSGGYVSKEHFSKIVQSADMLSKAQIFVDDSAGLNPIELRARARRMKRRFGIELIVVDYLQMLNYSQFAKDGRQRETAAISSSMKAMAKELKVPVIVLSQLNRSPETRDRKAVPKLSDLRDSGSIEQDADLVALLRRPCKYPEDPDFMDKTLSILDIAKQRNGPTGEIRLNFIEELTRFENRREGVDPMASYTPSSGEI